MKTPEFKWDRAHTHRVEALESVGTLIRLDDHCVIVMLVIPFPVCGIGKIEARGDLFDHMHDSQDVSKERRPGAP